MVEWDRVKIHLKRWEWNGENHLKWRKVPSYVYGRNREYHRRGEGIIE